jgi:hypothetical protein
LAGIHDPPVLHLDPGLELVGEAEPVGCFQFVEVAEYIGGWRVVAGDTEPEGQAVEPFYRPEWDPRRRGDRDSMRRMASSVAAGPLHCWLSDAQRTWVN